MRIKQVDLLKTSHNSWYIDSSQNWELQLFLPLISQFPSKTIMRIKMRSFPI